MIKRTESKSKCSRRERSERVKKKRRMMVEGLEKRQLLAAEVFLPDVDIPIFEAPRNIGTVQSFQAFESELLGESGVNDSIFGADFIPLGTGPGQQDNR